MTVGNASGDDAGDVDGRVLLFSSHDVETEAFLGFWQLHHARVGVSFACSKCCHCGLGNMQSAYAKAQLNTSRRILKNLNIVEKFFFFSP